MSPVARRQRGAHTGRMVITALVAIATALGVAFAVATLASRGDVDVRLGDDRFVAGSARDILDDIEERGAPLGFNDVANFARPIWVDNAGDDPETGWVAVGAFVPADPDCLVQWNADRDLFVSECDDEVTFPRSGEGLRQFGTSVTDGRLEIDLQDSAAGD